MRAIRARLRTHTSRTWADLCRSVFSSAYAGRISSRLIRMRHAVRQMSIEMAVVRNAFRMQLVRRARRARRAGGHFRGTTGPDAAFKSPRIRAGPEDNRAERNSYRPHRSAALHCALFLSQKTLQLLKNKRPIAVISEASRTRQAFNRRAH